MRSKILAAAFTAAFACAGAPAVAQAQEATGPVSPALTATGHKPGNVGYGFVLPEDTTYKTVDGDTVKHPCAGRKVIYQSHNDALYGTRINGDKLAIMAVDGQQVVSQDSLCYRLARDANAAGQEVSRMVIPETMPFLGTPGDTVWVAPQFIPFADQWRPLWSGIGAFDPAHEANPVPTNFTDEKFHFDLQKIDGPGDVNVFFKKWNNTADRVFSSNEAQYQSFTYKVGAHGHFNWTFSKPGIYALTWQGRAELTDGGQELTEPITQYWLVGDDPDVGFKNGTTRNLNPVTQYVDGTAPPSPAPTSPASPPSTSLKPSPSPSPSPSPNPSPSPSPEPNPSLPPVTTPETTEPADSKRCDAEAALRTKPEAFIQKGHMDLALEDAAGKMQARLHDDSDTSNPVSRQSGTFLFEVPDGAKTDVPANLGGSFLGGYPSIWVLPQAQDFSFPWLGFSTTGLKPDSLKEGTKAIVTMEDVTGPGRIMAWHEGIAGLEKELDSDDPTASLPYEFNAHDHLAFAFTEAGLYAATFVYTGTTKDGQPFREELRSSFAVGSDAIGTAHTHKKDGYANLGSGDDCTGGVNRPSNDSVPGALTKGLKEIEGAIVKLDKDAGPLFAQLHKKDASGTPGAAAVLTPVAQPSQPARASVSGNTGSGASQSSIPAATSAPASAPAGGSGGASGGGGGAPAPAAVPNSSVSSGSGADVPAPADGAVAADAPAEEVADAGTEAGAATGSGGIISSIDGNGPGSKPQQYEAASQGITAGGFWAGLAFGIGAMALIGGCVLFAAAWRALKQVRSKDADLVATQPIG
ncbi:choice-of-anchor M domain-containing protein [Corynebacterium qintianiae]|uniref:choice-of-anchor M domain-containing protein n=1 Tax=Corynebacterium qintianiae TaxID=2709392 RepID=UPI0013EA7219|nr:choice-of-anchor M domain-containing protein [Corynebacterium qintianiae]